MNKFLLLFALLLVVGVSLICISSAAIIYVPDNYALIQEAIDAASAGDTVMVRNGAYSENVVLNKTLSLIGEDLPTVDAQQSGSAIEITADSCVVNGFRCVNAKYPRNAGIKVFESNSNFIENITCCEKNNIGILLMDSSNNAISNFRISDSFFLDINTYKLKLFDGFSYISRTSGHPSTDKICKSAQKINRLIKSACRKNLSCKILSNFFQDA